MVLIGTIVTPRLKKNTLMIRAVRASVCARVCLPVTFSAVEHM